MTKGQIFAWGVLYIAVGAFWCRFLIWAAYKKARVTGERKQLKDGVLVFHLLVWPVVLPCFVIYILLYGVVRLASLGLKS